MLSIAKVEQRLAESLLWPACRAYSHHLLRDRPAGRVFGLVCGMDFRRVHHYWPDFRRPRSFEEKVWNRMLYVRNPVYTEFSDKLRARDFVARTVGAEHLVPLLWSGTDPEAIPFADLPGQFVIKANHGCYYNILVRDKKHLDLDKTKKTLRKWLSRSYSHVSMMGTEWAYRHIRPAVMVESFLNDDGKVPLDFKFFCFSGRAEYLQMNFDRFGKPYEKTFDRDFRPLDLWQGTRQYPWPVTPPANYADMIRIAETLAAGLDFLRVDLYHIGRRIYVGELTCYPGGGQIEWVPLKYDFILGSKWKAD